MLEVILYSETSLSCSIFLTFVCHIHVIHDILLFVQVLESTLLHLEICCHVFPQITEVSDFAISPSLLQ